MKEELLWRGALLKFLCLLIRIFGLFGLRRLQGAGGAGVIDEGLPSTSVRGQTENSVWGTQEVSKYKGELRKKGFLWTSCSPFPRGGRHGFGEADRGVNSGSEADCSNSAVAAEFIQWTADGEATGSITIRLIWGDSGTRLCEPGSRIHSELVVIRCPEVGIDGSNH